MTVQTIGSPSVDYDIANGDLVITWWDRQNGDRVTAVRGETVTSHVSGAAHAAPPTHKANTGHQPKGHNMNATATKTRTTTATGTCGHMGCTSQHDGQPWVLGIKLCWTHRLLLAGRRG